MTRCLWAMAVALLLAPAPAAAQHMDKTLFLEIVTGGDDDQRALLLVYLRGVLQGIESANIKLRRDDRPRLYCPTGDVPIDPDWLANELVGYVDRHPQIPDGISVPLLALFVLEENFTCEQRTGG